jgi:hypothetical protein
MEPERGVESFATQSGNALHNSAWRQKTMRMIKLAVVALTSVLFASASWATPLSTTTGYWEIQYTLGNSTMDIASPIGLLTAQLGPGDMTLQHQKPVDGGAARLAAFHLIENFNVSGVITDLTVDMFGDANGTLNTGTATVEWSTPADGWHTEGSIICTGGAFICGFAGLPNNVPIPLNATSDEPVGDWQITANGGNASWILPPDASGSTKTLNVVGTSVSKVWVQVPEPTGSLLVGLGLLGLAAARARRG